MQEGWNGDYTAVQRYTNACSHTYAETVCNNNIERKSFLGMESKIYSYLYFLSN